MLCVESLEDRVVPAYFVTDMTQLAKEFPTHSGPSMLYLNFAGNNAEGVTKFQAVSNDREQDIADIIFRVQEVFAPFNVQVRRISTEGVVGQDTGSSTIFVGDYAPFGTGVRNNNGGVTPSGSADYPGLSNPYHQVNSDDQDIAFVDPVFFHSGQLESVSIREIVRGIVHEAGHTFGLGHVTTDSITQPDVMSYDDLDNTRFMNTTFNITDRNFDAASGTTTHTLGVVPTWHAEGSVTPILDPMVTQNSYTFLTQVLGSHAPRTISAIAQSDYVDPTFIDTAKTATVTGVTYKGSVGQGEFNVFNFTPTKTQQYVIDVTRTTGSLDSELLVYNGSSFTDVLAYNDDASASNTNSHILLSLQAGMTFQIVVGSHSSATAGTFNLNIKQYLPGVQNVPPGPVQTVGNAGANATASPPPTVVLNSGLVTAVTRATQIAPTVAPASSAPVSSAKSPAASAIVLASDDGKADPLLDTLAQVGASV